LLGTYVEITLKADNNVLSQAQLLELSEACFEAIMNVQRRMSFHDEQSELSRINQLAAGDRIELSDEMFSVLDLVRRLHKQSNGIFDPCIAPTLIESKNLPRPNYLKSNFQLSRFGRWESIELQGRSLTLNRPVLIDLGGIAKGFAIDQALACCNNNTQVTINAGGDIGMSHWQNQSVAIRYQADLQHSKSTPMLNACVASSADYFSRNRTIVDPTSEQVEHQQKTRSDKCFTVFANNGMIADALTKLAYLGQLNDELLRYYRASLLVSDRSGNQQQFNASKFAA